MNMIEGTEWCPWCEDETDFKVDEKTWVVKCQRCGRPMLLCDKCYTLNGSDRPCGCCNHERKLHKMMKEWEKEQIGKVVYWNDPDGDTNSDYMKVIGFCDDVYVLKHIFEPEKERKRIEAYDYELQFLDEDEQIKVYVNYFNSEAYKNGEI